MPHLVDEQFTVPSHLSRESSGVTTPVYGVPEGSRGPGGAPPSVVQAGSRTGM